jgi:hypothetical protein
MKIFLKIVVLILIFQFANVFACINSEKLHDRILDSFTNHSLYVVINVESDAYNGKVIIQNRHLFLFLKEYNKLDRENYKSFMKELLSKNSELSIRKTDLEKWKFNKVPKDESVEVSAKKGKDFFIENYFRNGFLKEDANGNLFTIIAQLFEWKIATKIDDETGVLRLIRTDISTEQK